MGLCRECSCKVLPRCGVACSPFCDHVNVNVNVNVVNVLHLWFMRVWDPTGHLGVVAEGKRLGTELSHAVDSLVDSSLVGKE